MNRRAFIALGLGAIGFKAKSKMPRTTIGWDWLPMKDHRNNIQTQQRLRHEHDLVKRYLYGDWKP